MSKLVLPLSVLFWFASVSAHSGLTNTDGFSSAANHQIYSTYPSIPSACSLGSTSNLICGVSVSGTVYNETIDLSTLGNRNLTGSITTALGIGGSIKGSFSPPHMYGNITLQGTTMMQLKCDGICKIERRALRGKVLVEDFLSKLRQPGDQSIQKVPGLRIVASIIIPWHAYMYIHANTSFSYTQSFEISSSTGAPRLSAVLGTPDFKINHLHPLNNNSMLKIRGALKMKPSFYAKLKSRNAGWGETTMDGVSGFSFYSRFRRKTFPAQPELFREGDSCHRDHHWRGFLKPYLGPITSIFDSSPTSLVSVGTDKLENVAPVNAHKICGIKSVWLHLDKDFRVWSLWKHFWIQGF